MGKALGDDSDEELYGLDPHELSLTIAPMNKEDFLMTKAAITEEQFAQVLKALETEPDDFDKETIAKAMTLVNDGFEKAMPAALKEALERKQGKKKDKDDDDDEDEEELAKAINDMDEKARKSLVTLSTMMKPLAKSFPGFASILKALDRAKKSDPDKFPDGEDATKKSAVEVFKSQYPDVAEALTKPLSDQLTKTNEVLAEIQKSAALKEMTELAKEMPHLKGKPDEVAERLRVMKSELSPGNWDAFVEDQKGIAATISKSSAFSRTSSGGSESGTAVQRVIAKAKEIVAKSANRDMSEAEAITEIVKNDPELYSEYLAEQRATAATARR